MWARYQVLAAACGTAGHTACHIVRCNKATASRSHSGASSPSPPPHLLHSDQDAALADVHPPRLALPGGWEGDGAAPGGHLQAAQGKGIRQQQWW